MPPVDVASITAVDWQPLLGAFGDIVEGVDDVNQCIRTILATPKGSVPHHPDFGSNIARYVDWPLQIARPNIVRETVDAIAANEPRVQLSRVSVESASTSDPALVGAIALEVEWVVEGTPAAGTTTLLVGRASL